MADEISQIVEVYISRETAQIDTASFSIPLLMVNLPDTIDNSNPGNPVNVPANVTNRVQVFTSATGVADVFGDGSVAHQMAIKLLGGDTRPAQFMVGVKNSTETYTQGLNAIMEYNDDWYMMAIDSKTEGDIKEVAAVIQATRKKFMASTADVATVDPASTTDIGSFLKDTGYDKTSLTYHTLAATQHPEVVWMGGQITAAPGSNTWAFKAGPGLTVDRLNSTAIAALKEKNVNFFTRVGGVNMFQTGVSSQGEFWDTMIFLDWVQARMEEQIFYRIATKAKIPYTSSGVMIIEAEIRSVLDQGVANGGIADAPQYQVQSPSILDIPEVQRAQRILGDFRFQFRLASAVHRVIVRGVVSY